MREHKYDRADEATEKLAGKVAAKWHSDLADAGVTIDIVFVWAEQDGEGQPKGSALTHHGDDALAISQQSNLLHRALGQADILMRLNGDLWKDLSHAQREALLDHELEHFTLKRDELSQPVTDDLQRPRLDFRGHDIAVEGFASIAKRHGKNSPEFAMAEAVTPAWGQTLLDFREDQVA
jgi:hypothetical protein